MHKVYRQVYFSDSSMKCMWIGVERSEWVANLCNRIRIGRHCENVGQLHLLTLDDQGDHNETAPKGARSHHD